MRLGRSLALLAILTLAVGCAAPTPAPPPTPTLTLAPTATPSLPLIPTPTITPRPTPNQTPTPRPSPPPTPLPTPIPTPTVRLAVTFQGEFPGGTQHIRQAFERVYPYLVKYLGEPFSLGSTGVTWIYDPQVTTSDQVGWFAKDNSIKIGPVPRILQPPSYPELPQYWNLYQQLDHETAHLFLDVGDTAIEFTFGQWIWESHAVIGQNLAYAELFGEGVTNHVLPYDSLANLGWERVNGVLRDAAKYNRTIVDASATSALRLMTEVLSPDTGLDFMRRVNAGILGEYRASGSSRITAEKYKAILNKAAGNKTLDGMPPGDWLFAQPVSNNDGALGTYLIVYPAYSIPMSGQIELTPTRFAIAAFERQAGAGPNEPHETGLSNLDVTLTLLDASGQSLRQTAVKTGGDGLLEIDAFSPTAALSVKDLQPGAYLVRAQATSKGNQLEITNFFVVGGQIPRVTSKDSRMFIVPLNADGTALRPDLVDKLTVKGGQKQTSLPGVLVVTAEPGTGVEIALGTFRAVVSKPVTSRLVSLKIP